MSRTKVNLVLFQFTKQKSHGFEGEKGKKKSGPSAGSGWMHHANVSFNLHCPNVQDFMVTVEYNQEGAESIRSRADKIYLSRRDAPENFV